MGMDDISSPGLILGLGFPPSPLDPQPKTADKLKPPSSFDCLDLDPCLALSLSGKVPVERRLLDVNKASSFEEESGGGGGGGLVSSPLSGVSSFSTAKATTASVKREREASSDDTEIERVSYKASDEEDDLGGGGGSNARKKLRLSKDQSALLEESFKQHSTLNPKQKQILARQLNLRPRQVEVWFQNRRARTKLKQTEVDCELLKNYCETLTDENRRLQKELQELKSLKLAQPFYMHVPASAAAATLTMCPSCERVCGGGDNKSPKSPFSMAPTATTATKPQFYAHLHQFANPSAAC